MKLLLVFIAMLLLTACGKSEPMWSEEHKPITKEERDCMANFMIAMRPTVSNLSLGGFDQDIEDYMDSTKYAAVQACVTPRMFEYVVENHQRQYTGRWKTFDK